MPVSSAVGNRRCLPVSSCGECPAIARLWRADRRRVRSTGRFVLRMLGRPPLLFDLAGGGSGRLPASKRLEHETGHWPGCVLDVLVHDGHKLAGSRGVYLAMDFSSSRHFLTLWRCASGSETASSAPLSRSRLCMHGFSVLLKLTTGTAHDFAKPLL